MKSEFTLNELRKMDLNLLVVLSVLVRERSVRQTAALLHVGSPAISMSLNRLRELMNDQLLVRTGRGMTPTPKALELVTLIDPFLQDLRLALLERDQFDPATVTRVVRFAIADDLEAALLPSLIRALQEQAPGVRLVVRDADYHCIDKMLQSGDAEVVLAALLPELQLREPYQILYEEGFVALFDPKQIVLTTPIGLEEYLATPQLLISPRGEICGMLEPPLQALGRTRNVIATLARFSTLPLVLKETPILCNVPSMTAHFLADHFGLALSALPFNSSRFNIGIAWQHVLNQDPFTRWFISLVSELMMQLRDKLQASGNLQECVFHQSIVSPEEL